MPIMPIIAITLFIVIVLIMALTPVIAEDQLVDDEYKSLVNKGESSEEI